ncbi:MAG: hypothetical protein P4N41_20330 [Negativicutes bacterium]|nr:hypothetical protein [Negativicutes bacterium]
MQPAPGMQQDIRDIIFAGISDHLFNARIIAEHDGIVSGAARLRDLLATQGVKAKVLVADGAAIRAGETVAKLCGTPKQIAVAEESVIGVLAKFSGIASAARRAVEAAGPELKVVCGAWKKMPGEIKTAVREAITHGKAAFRITDEPFLYLDKNFVRMLGGVEATLRSVAAIGDKRKVIQLKGNRQDIVKEALDAAQCGADIIMVDTGQLDDLTLVHAALQDAGCRDRIRLAFAKGIRVESISELKGKGIDILDIGVAIVDAPLLDMKLEVEGVAG